MIKTIVTSLEAKEEVTGETRGDTIGETRGGNKPSHGEAKSMAIPTQKGLGWRKLHLCYTEQNTH